MTCHNQDWGSPPIWRNKTWKCTDEEEHDVMEHAELQKFDQGWDVKLVISITIKATHILDTQNFDCRQTHTFDAQKLEMHQSRKDSSTMKYSELHNWFYGNPPILTHNHWECIEEEEDVMEHTELQRIDCGWDAKFVTNTTIDGRLNPPNLTHKTWKCTEEDEGEDVVEHTESSRDIWLTSNHGVNKQARGRHQ